MITHKEAIHVLHNVLPAAVAGAFLKVLENVDEADGYADRLQAVYDGCEIIKQAAIQNAADTGTDLFS